MELVLSEEDVIDNKYICTAFTKNESHVALDVVYAEYHKPTNHLVIYSDNNLLLDDWDLKNVVKLIVNPKVITTGIKDLINQSTNIS